MAVVAAALRIPNLAYPPGRIFDEQHYVKHAETFLDRGVEWNTELDTPDFVVHPPLGKWCIALGEAVFGRDEFGWRIAAAAAGVLSVIVLIRLARQLFGSTVLGCAAGLLLALDGFQFVLSRFALLDIFLQLFLLASFACLIYDRTARRAGGSRWWRPASAVLLGCALGVKWSAAVYAVAFVVFIIVWDLGARRCGRSWSAPRLLGSITAYTAIVFFVYLATWSGWLLSDDGWGRHLVGGGALGNLIHYHQLMFTSTSSITAHHEYQSGPWQWLLQSRPVAFYRATTPGCGTEQCDSEVLLLGTPALWWAFIPAMLGTAWLGISRRDWRAWPILTGSLIGIFLPWIWLGDRTMFAFYAATAEPFLILAVTFALGAIIGRPRDSPRRRAVGIFVATGYVTLVAVCFAYFYPIYVAEPIAHSAWWARMWLGERWI